MNHGGEGADVVRNPKPLRLICVAVLSAGAAYRPRQLCGAGARGSAQQSRIQQADQQLAAVRRSIDSSTAVSQDMEARLTNLLAEQSRVPPDRRAQLEDAINGVRSEQARVDRELQQARSREN